MCIGHYRGKAKTSSSGKNALGPGIEIPAGTPAFLVTAASAAKSVSAAAATAAAAAAAGGSSASAAAAAAAAAMAAVDYRETRHVVERDADPRAFVTDKRFRLPDMGVMTPLVWGKRHVAPAAAGATGVTAIAAMIPSGQIVVDATVGTAVCLLRG